MTFANWLILGGLLAGVLGGTGGLFWYLIEQRKARDARETADATRSAEAAKQLSDGRLADLAANMELGKYVDSRVDKAVAPLQEEVRELKDELRIANERATTAVGELNEVKAIVARFLSTLQRWDRHGPMPMPSDADMTRLGVDPEKFRQ